MGRQKVSVGFIDRNVDRIQLSHIRERVGKCICVPPPPSSLFFFISLPPNAHLPSSPSSFHPDTLLVSLNTNELSLSRSLSLARALSLSLLSLSKLTISLQALPALCVCVCVFMCVSMCVCVSLCMQVVLWNRGTRPGASCVMTRSTNAQTNLTLLWNPIGPACSVLGLFWPYIRSFLAIMLGPFWILLGLF